MTADTGSERRPERDDARQPATPAPGTPVVAPTPPDASAGPEERRTPGRPTSERPTPERKAPDHRAQEHRPGTPDRPTADHSTPDHPAPDHPTADRERPAPRPGEPLLPHKERDGLHERLHHALAGFIDEPASAVQEAEGILREATESLNRRLTERRETLHRGCTDGDTEHLRTALRDYRDLLERIVSV
ncbi:hypothetical protein AB0M28_35630 [Streptomyces sp. NPDC051940]|uniref:hypothetical protein n=1 Tax=Streptomyces sp. NPDC051940 TaxID=3155675 RepID=UPI00341D428B